MVNYIYYKYEEKFHSKMKQVKFNERYMQKKKNYTF